MSREEFNSNWKICTNNTINDSAKDNYNNFIRISKELQQILTNKFETISYYTQNVLMPLQIAQLNSTMEDNFRVFGNAECKNKYLKYKKNI
jgi:hypothetical protein